MTPAFVAVDKSLEATYDSVAAFFFFLPLFLARGSSRILRISSSVILLSVLNLVRSHAEGPPSLVMPFLVIAA
jgi:hypothetical protein